jgi:hypothetical protein
MRGRNCVLVTNQPALKSNLQRSAEVRCNRAVN